MKICVVMVGYQCASNLDKVLEPWIESKNNIEGVSFKFGFTTALFKERAEMGETYNNEETEQKLSKLYKDGILDHLFVVKQPILDFQSRFFIWNTMGKIYDFDFIWQLDMDEFYTFEQIRQTCEWLKDNNLYDFYKINFKNYFGKLEDGTFVDDFKPTRIINNRNNGGVNNFYWDNEVEFFNKVRTPNCAGTQIPKRICNPRHLSWVGDKEFLKNKIEYQKRAIKTCSYRYNDELDRLEFDDNYYNKLGISKPTIHKD